MAAKKLLMYAFIAHMLPKFVPFPFFMPLVLGMMGFIIYAAEKGKERNICIALVAFQFAPYVVTVTKDLNDIETWGNKGPNNAPMKGIYMFDGLGAATFDFSNCLWHEKSKVAYCHLPKVMAGYPSGIDLEKAGFDMTADSGAAGPTKEELSVTMPWQMFWFFYHVSLHNRLDFHFNEELNEAQVFENVCLAVTASPSPLSLLFPYGICTTATIYPLFRVFTMVRDNADPPTWYRNTYYQEKSLWNTYDPVMVADKQKRAGGTAYPAKMKFGDGYRLQPLLTPNKDGTQKLHKANLKKAIGVSATVITRDI